MFLERTPGPGYARLMTDPSYDGWSILKAVLADDRLTQDDIRFLVKLAVNVYAPPADPARDEKRARANATMLDMIIQTGGRRAPGWSRDDAEVDVIDGDAPSAQVPVRMTATEIIAAHRKALGSEVIQLPDNPVAKTIILADMKRRAETPPGGLR